MSEKKMKNRYCIGSHISESAFYHIVWQLLIMSSQDNAIKYIHDHAKIKLSRQTLSRYWLMIGDHFYNLYFDFSVIDEQMEKWAMTGYGMYRALSLLPQEANFPLINEASKKWSSNMVNPEAFDRIRDYVKIKKGLKFSTFTSWQGIFEHIARLWILFTKRHIKPDLDQFYHYLHQLTMSNLSAQPINPSSLRKYRLLKKKEGIEVTVLIGNRVVMHKLCAYQ